VRHRPLAIACRSVVVVWGMVILGTTAHPDRPEVTAPAPDDDRKATIVPHREAASRAPEQTPDPPREEPSSPSPMEPATLTRVGSADVERGSALLDASGSFPALSCSYEDFTSFREYASAMETLGGRFVVVRDRAIVGGVNLSTATLTAAPGAGGFSPRARDYTGEPVLEFLTLSVRREYGVGAEVMLLVPRHIDAGLFGAIARSLTARGDHHGDYREFRARYLRGPDSGVRLAVDRGIRRDGSSVPLDWTFDLAGIPG